MARFGCPHCGSSAVEEKDIYVRIYYNRVAEWKPDGTPGRLEEGAWGDVEHLEEDLGLHPEAVEPGGKYICAECDRSFSRPAPLEGDGSSTSRAESVQAGTGGGG